MHQQHAVLGVRERAVTHPFEQRFGVRRVEDLADRVAGPLGADAGGDGKQVQVMVAEHDRRARAELDEAAQGGERGRAAVDDVAGDPERRVAGQRQRVDELLEGGVTALNVADGDGVVRHEVG